MFHYIPPWRACKCDWNNVRQSHWLLNIPWNIIPLLFYACIFCERMARMRPPQLKRLHCKILHFYKNSSNHLGLHTNKSKHRFPHQIYWSLRVFECIPFLPRSFFFLRLLFVYTWQIVFFVCTWQFVVCLYEKMLYVCTWQNFVCLYMTNVVCLYMANYCLFIHDKLLNVYKWQILFVYMWQMLFNHTWDIIVCLTMTNVVFLYMKNCFMSIYDKCWVF